MPIAQGSILEQTQRHASWNNAINPEDITRLGCIQAATCVNRDEYRAAFKAETVRCPPLSDVRISMTIRGDRTQIQLELLRVAVRW